MLGFGDGWVFSAYFLSILSSLLCVIYGIIKWNSDGEKIHDEEQEEWLEQEMKIEKPL